MPDGSETRHINGRKMNRLIAIIGSCLLAIFGGMYLSLTGPDGHGVEQEPIVEKNRADVTNDRIQTKTELQYDAFIIPTEHNDKFTYMTFSITFEVSNQAVIQEMLARKHQLRGIIYDNLIRKIDDENAVPTVEQIKRFMIETVNGAVSAGSVDDAYVTDFLAV